MKTLRDLASFTLAALLLAAAAGCDREPPPAPPAAAQAATRYVCPMHSHVVSDHPGKCPICGMTLVPQAQEAPDASAPRTVSYYRHPHDPTITSPVPMQDEMGMDYVPVYAAGDGRAVAVDAAMQQSLGVRTATAERGKLWRRIDTVGFVEYATEDVTRVRPRIAGWVRRVDLTALGTQVARGTRLFTLYAPELVAAQREFLAARASGDAALAAAARARLGAFGVADGEVERLVASGTVEETIGVYAPRAGVISEIVVAPGAYVTPDTATVTISDRSQLWVTAEVFPAQAAWLREGAAAEVRDPARPGAPAIETRIERIATSVDATTRAVRVRLPIAPAEARTLRAEMYVDVTLFGGARDGVLTVPRDAVIRTGDGARVVVALGDGRFRARAVEVGMESGDRLEIVRGLDEGEQVVVSAQFLLDSEASLGAGLDNLDPQAEH